MSRAPRTHLAEALFNLIGAGSGGVTTVFVSRLLGRGV